jgi:osmotically inducible protein OsmC
MPVRVASAEWKGNLPKGRGTLESETGAVRGAYTFASRFEEGSGTNPEELIGAAHAGCFSMAFANILAKAGFEPTSIRTRAKVHLDKGPDGFGISKIVLECQGQVPGVDETTFQLHAREAKTGCPVSRALAATPIELTARLES